jgi:predicted site-specific integrase-resolvase
MPDLVSTAWAAQALGVHSATVRRMVKSGDLQPAAKSPGLRGGYLFHQADIIRIATKRGAAA